MLWCTGPIMGTKNVAGMDLVKYQVHCHSFFYRTLYCSCHIQDHGTHHFSDLNSHGKNRITRQSHTSKKSCVHNSVSSIYYIGIKVHVQIAIKVFQSYHNCNKCSVHVHVYQCNHQKKIKDFHVNLLCRNIRRTPSYVHNIFNECTGMFVNSSQEHFFSVF